jgi:hypothetical protein
MKMILVETTGSFQYIDPITGVRIRHEGLTVVPKTTFIEERIQTIIIHAHLKDEATDDEWLAHVAECKDDTALALSAYLSSFGADVDGGKKKKEAASTGKPDVK